MPRRARAERRQRPCLVRGPRAYIERHGKPLAFYSDKTGIFRANRQQTPEGRGLGRVERMNGTLQDRLVKELRLRGISSMANANAYAPAFIADFNARFAKVQRSDFNAHRPLHNHEDIRRIFCWREWRKVTHSLSLQYDKTLYLLEDLPEHRQLIHRYIEVAEYPDGAIELWADDTSLPYTTHYRYPDVDQAAIVEN